MAEASPTLHSDNQGTHSGDDGTDVGPVTTKDPTPDLTQTTFAVDYIDNTETTTMEEEGTVTLHTGSGWRVQCKSSSHLFPKLCIRNISSIIC